MDVAFVMGDGNAAVVGVGNRTGPESMRSRERETEIERERERERESNINSMHK
jgi:hypothetical protein